MTKIRIPQHIAQLGTYKPGKGVADVFDGMNVERRTILSSNENNYGPSPKALEKIQEVLPRLHEYPDPSNERLRAALSKHLDISPERLLVGNGSDSLLSCLFQEFFEPGDELLTSEGTFMTVSVFAAKHQVSVVKVPMGPGYLFDLQAIRDSVTDKTRAIYLCNPNNPTGTIIPRADLETFIDSVPSHILVIVDEAYFEYASVLNDQYPDSSRYEKENVLTYRTFSKVYGLGGMRLGYAIGAPDVIEVLRKIRLTFEPSSVAQAAGIGALEDEAFLSQSVVNNRIALKRMEEVFKQTNTSFVRGYGNFVFVPFPSQDHAHGVFQKLFEKGVFTRRLDFFGFSHALRISTGTEEDMAHFSKSFLELL